MQYFCYHPWIKLHLDCFISSSLWLCIEAKLQKLCNCPNTYVQNCIFPYFCIPTNGMVYMCPSAVTIYLTWHGYRWHNACKFSNQILYKNTVWGSYNLLATLALLSLSIIVGQVAFSNVTLTEDKKKHHMDMLTGWKTWFHPRGAG